MIILKLLLMLVGCIMVLDLKICVFVLVTSVANVFLNTTMMLINVIALAINVDVAIKILFLFLS